MVDAPQAGAAEAPAKGAAGGAGSFVKAGGRGVARLASGPIGMALSAAQFMKHDAASGNSARTWLRGVFGIDDDPNEPAPWVDAKPPQLASGVHA